MTETANTLPQLTRRLEQDVLVELWEIDLRAMNGPVVRLCNQKNELEQNIVWRGQVYSGYPLKADGFELTSQGASNRPKLTLANVEGAITAAAESYRNLVGATVIRRLTYARFLDAANFAAGNPHADPNQEAVSIYLVERLESLNSESAVLELSSPAETDNAYIPARIMLAGTCCWHYRGEGCGYTGGAVADRFDVPTEDSLKDECSKTLTGCRARFGATAVLPFGGFPSADKVTV
ncbi:phage minor tail protein L [Neisseria leonii]|uniref:Phage minor tail protein L n=1 Tax=Neisseria leonii TaxID=2995413 RepID=A0A9X4E794_9NEIS|nr:phage minor tail protein L [Neisseria sp. 51.81]MDD9326753.1 phage minor tail protein L [Neisseria sp. 51.81]